MFSVLLCWVAGVIIHFPQQNHARLTGQFKLNEEPEHRESSLRQADPEEQKLTSKIRQAYKTKAKSKKI